jgi:hypothetical protein
LVLYKVGYCDNSSGKIKNIVYRGLEICYDVVGIFRDLFPWRNGRGNVTSGKKFVEEKGE